MSEDFDKEKEQQMKDIREFEQALLTNKCQRCGKEVISPEFAPEFKDTELTELHDRIKSEGLNILNITLHHNFIGLNCYPMETGNLSLDHIETVFEQDFNVTQSTVKLLCDKCKNELDEWIKGDEKK